jgi:hypothetical protein
MDRYVELDAPRLEWVHFGPHNWRRSWSLHTRFGPGNSSGATLGLAIVTRSSSDCVQGQNGK